MLPERVIELLQAQGKLAVIPSRRNKESLQRTICLLGNLVKAGSLNEKPRQELVSLIGSCPTPAQAALWKASLRQLSNSMRHG